MRFSFTKPPCGMLPVFLGTVISLLTAGDLTAEPTASNFAENPADLSLE
jgi:hypothetical protein